MCIICDKYRAGKVTGKEALMAMAIAAEEATKPTVKADIEAHMFELTEEILGNDVPMKERDANAEEVFWKMIHKGDQDE